MRKFTSLLFALIVCVIVSMIVAANVHTLKPVVSHTERANVSQGVRGVLYKVTIRKPDSAPLVELAGLDPQGRAGKVACSTCHSVRKPNVENRTSAALDEFHQGLQVSHGALACYSCHNSANADTLRLADGTAVEYSDVMTLCAQCHSKQAESFAHGAHGGMNGFWDLSRGPQTKNNCIDCHDPHAPNYPQMIVGFKPRDRFLDTEVSHDDHE